MAKNEDGEFELILGNKQLLGMFFVVIVLLGVFFIMGYVVGRNSAPLVGAEPSTARKADTKPLVVESPAPKTSAPETAPPSETVAKAPETKPELPRPEPPKPEPAKAEPIKPSISKSEPAAPKRETAKEAAKEKARPVAQSSGPVAGQTYLQLVATTKHDADGTVDVLRKNGFPALDVEVPEKPGLFRVLVGPLAPGEMNKMKADLQAKGLPGNAAIPKKY